MAKQHVIGMVFGFALAGIVGVSAGVHHLAHAKSTQVVDKKPINVKVSSAVVKVIPKEISAVGHMRAINKASLSFTLAGKISKIYVAKGRVKKGDLLVQLENKEDLAQLKSDQATLKLNTTTYARFLKLSKLGDVAQQMLEQKKEALETAQAAVQKDQAILGQKQIRAPFSGVLSTTDLSVGSYVAAGQNVMNIVQLAPLKARYSVPASLKSELEVGQNVIVSTQGKSSKKNDFKGIVSYIEPNVNSDSGTITLEAKVLNKNFALSPGMFVSITEIVDPDRKLLVIPDIALMTDVRGRYVFVLDGNKVRKQYVTVGLIQNSHAAIEKGLKAGDQVVTAGQQRLYDDYVVKVVH